VPAGEWRDPAQRQPPDQPARPEQLQYGAAFHALIVDIYDGDQLIELH
jgi:hypothetical protein